MTELRCLYEGTETEEEIDHLGHMNVRFYATKAMQATEAFAEELGLDPQRLSELGAVLSVTDARRNERRAVGSRRWASALP